MTLLAPATSMELPGASTKREYNRFSMIGNRLRHVSLRPVGPPPTASSSHNVSSRSLVSQGLPPNRSIDASSPCMHAVISKRVGLPGRLAAVLAPEPARQGPTSWWGATPPCWPPPRAHHEGSFLGAVQAPLTCCQSVLSVEFTRCQPHYAPRWPICPSLVHMLTAMDTRAAAAKEGILVELEAFGQLCKRQRRKKGVHELMYRAREPVCTIPEMAWCETHDPSKLGRCRSKSFHQRVLEKHSRNRAASLTSMPTEPRRALCSVCTCTSVLGRVRALLILLRIYSRILQSVTALVIPPTFSWCHSNPHWLMTTCASPVLGRGEAFGAGQGSSSSSDSQRSRKQTRGRRGGCKVATPLWILHYVFPTGLCLYP